MFIMEFPSYSTFMLVIKINQHLKRAEIVYKRKIDEKFESNRPAIVQTDRDTY